MSDIITTLHEKGNPSNEVYPNIKGENIPDNAITTLKVNNNAITNEKINDGAISTAKIQDGAITTNKISNGSVTSQKINDGSISIEKLSFGLYEHNIVIANEPAVDIDKADNFAVFKIITQSPNEYTSVDDFALLLYDRGFKSISTMLMATGRNGSESFEFLSDVNFQDQTKTNGYCSTYDVGVYVDSDLDFHVVYCSLNEGDTKYLYSDIPNYTYFNDNVVQLF